MKKRHLLCIRRLFETLFSSSHGDGSIYLELVQNQTVFLHTFLPFRRQPNIHCDVSSIAYKRLFKESIIKNLLLNFKNYLNDHSGWANVRVGVLFLQFSHSNIFKNLKKITYPLFPLREPASPIPKNENHFLDMCVQ